MKHNNPWKGPVENLPEGGQFTHDGDVAIQVMAIGKEFEDLQYTPVVHVHAGDGIDELRTAVIEWIEQHSNDSLPGVQSVDYNVLIVAPEGEQLAEEEFTPEGEFPSAEFGSQNVPGGGLGQLRKLAEQQPPSQEG